jgi:hypothetical protein
LIGGIRNFKPTKHGVFIDFFCRKLSESSFPKEPSMCVWSLGREGFIIMEIGKVDILALAGNSKSTITY